MSAPDNPTRLLIFPHTMFKFLDQTMNDRQKLLQHTGSVMNQLQKKCIGLDESRDTMNSTRVRTSIYSQLVHKHTNAHTHTHTYV